MTDEPNILLIYSDQHRGDCLGVNGHPLLETPNLDRMAEEGVDFERAYCPIPLCVPARSTLLTGEWPTGHLSIANYDTESPRPLRGDLPTFSELLKEVGYRLGYVGKWHVDQYKSPLQYDFHEYAPQREYADWRKEQGLLDRPRQNKWFGETDPHIDPDQSRLAWGADRIVQSLERYGAEEEPFFLRWDPVEPHLPNVVPEPYASMYDPEEIPPWPGFEDDLEDKPYAQRQQLRTWRLEDWDWSDWAKVVARYLGEISLLDRQMGRILAALERLDLEKNTFVIYTSDHGDMCGSHGMIDKHFVMYEDVLHVPLIVRPPLSEEPEPEGREEDSSPCRAFVSNSLDLASTFLDIANVEPPETFRGDSLLPFLTRPSRGGRSEIFATYHGNQFGLFSQRAVTDGEWKYVWNATARDELYHLSCDPGELHNLARDRGSADKLRDLRRRLVKWMEKTEDSLLNPWTRKQLEEGLTV